MVRVSKKNVNGVTAELNPELEERKRLKKLAFSKNILSETPARAYAQLSPSKTVIKHHGKDILKKSQRKNRFLFSFPGLLAPITGGKIGELKDLGTKNPILYLDFPQGQMKLFGTIVYPKNSYLTLQFSRGGKNVMCEDYFDTMIVFSDAWWIGKKDENPNENRLEFPEELNEGQPVDCDFKGGAGATSEIKTGANRSGMKSIEEQSHKTELENDSSDDENKLIDLREATPVRHYERTAGETLNYTDASSRSDSVYNDAEIFQEKIEVGVEGASSSRTHTLGKTEKSCPVVINVDNGNAAARMPPTRSEEISPSNHRSLVQATISTLFKKARKKAPTDLRKSPSGKVSGHKMQHRTLKRKIDQADGPRKKGKVIGKEKAGSETTAKKKQSEVSSSVEPDKVYQRKTKGQAASAASGSVDDPVSPDPISNLSAASSQVEDDIEDFSSTSQDTDDSDEDWAA